MLKGDGVETIEEKQLRKSRDQMQSSRRATRSRNKQKSSGECSTRIPFSGACKFS